MWVSREEHYGRSHILPSLHVSIFYKNTACVPQKRFEKHSKDGKILNSKTIEFMHQIILEKKFESICLHYSQMIIHLFFITS